MERQLTDQQARDILALHRRHPGARVLVHERAWGIVVEARRDERAVELRRFDWTGAIVPDTPLSLAVA